jgi:hypothetical protein
MPSTLKPTSYLRLLEPWARAIEPALYRPPDRPDLLVYGTGYNGWGVQTQQKALAALAVLAADPEFDEARAGVSRDVLRERALDLLRFTLESHIEGSYHCTDGASWGHTWISALGVERMMHGMEALEPHLTDDDRNLLCAVLLSESAWLLEHYPVEAGPVERNKPESNIWNGALLHRAAALYPDDPRAAAFREKGTRFLLNGISLPDDASSAQLVDGRPLSEWHVGHNFFPTLALNHHRYLNVGYMVICLSNIAMLHFAYRTRGEEAPAALYHHAEELWALVKACTFPDGRLLRIGGDTRVRYCYCQDYAIPMWLLAAQRFGDPHAAAFEAGWLAQVERETADNGDGTFLSGRCAGLAASSALYYTRLESDRAATLSMGAYWRRLVDIPAEIVTPEPQRFAWHDPYHGASYHCGPNRLVSWVWDAAEPPQGLCLPVDGSDMAEWRENLAGRILGEGRLHPREIISHEEQQFDGGFLTWGRMACRTGGMPAEGQPDEETAVLWLVAAALPDDTTLLVLQYARTPDRRVYLAGVAGINLMVPNDLFNDCHRTYHTEHGPLELPGFGSAEEMVATGSRWLNVEDRLGVIAAYGTDQLFLHRPGRRQIGIRPRAGQNFEQSGGMLYADEIVAPWQQGLRPYDPGSVLFDLGIVVQAGVPRDATARVSREGSAALALDEPEVRGLQLTGLDGQTYLLLANFGGTTVSPRLSLPGETGLTDLATSKSVALSAEIPLPAVRLFRIDRD